MAILQGTLDTLKKLFNEILRFALIHTPVNSTRIDLASKLLDNGFYTDWTQSGLQQRGSPFDSCSDEKTLSVWIRSRDQVDIASCFKK